MAGRDTSPTSTSSTLSCITVATEQQPASRSSSTALGPMSTPPTSLGDEASVLSDAMKMETHVQAQEEIPAPSAQTEVQATPQPTPEAPKSEGRRSARSSRASVTTYNVQILAGTAIHTPTKYLEKHHKNVLHGSIEDVVKTNTVTPPKKRVVKLNPEDINDPVEAQLATEAAQAAQRRKPPRVDYRREAILNLTEKAPGLLSNMKNKVQQALRIDMNDSGPKAYDPSAKSPPKRARISRAAESEDEEDEEEEEEDEEKEYLKPKTKKWEQHGLYVGQHRDFDARLSESQNRVRRKSKKVQENEVLPLPMFAGERMLSADFRRDFKLPFEVYNPLPRKVKVDGWVKLSKNRFIGDASALWKRDKQDSSSCYCEPEEGCGEACHNRIMAYECDSTNCRLTPEQCGNRPFAQLRRRAKGNGYDYGVEVLETEDRGYGVRAMRTFEPHQIIVEYAGEIITQAECERRMKHVYKKDKCYYLMSFDNKMIIDATRGTIARFVNHSCEPNCEMIKWTVSGEPRMALFAGSRGITTGEELTYDYNFDPFSSKNIQACRCGTKSCRGVLGPKPKHQPKEEKSIAASILAGTKRKFQEVFGSGSGSSSDPNSPKKRAMITAAVTKAKNALAESAAAREKAEKSAVEYAAQKADRENRAMRRTKSMTLSTRRADIVRRATRFSLPVTKSTRHTTLNFKRRTPKTMPKPGALKAVHKSGITSMIKRSTAALQGKGRLPPTRTPNSPARDSTPESDDSESDESPNITPASLRSASKKSVEQPAKSASTGKFTQTKLPFKPLDFGASSSRTSDALGFPDSEDDAEKEFGSTAKRAKKGHVAANTVRAGVKQTLNRSIRSSKRAVGVAKTGAALGFKGIGGLREGGSGSTIRMITGADD